MNWLIDLIAPYWGYVLGGIGAVLAVLFGVRKVKSDAKKEGVQQERSRQVEAARKETTVAVETQRKAQAAPKAEIDQKFSKYVRKPK